jgi:putative ABC transport system substrate-binding protein
MSAVETVTSRVARLSRKRAKPSELPMEQPAKFDTVVNLRTARTLRLSIPQKVLLRANTVIE